MARKKAMTDDELSALVQGEIDDAKTYVDEEFSEDRDEAIRFFNGDPTILPAMPGRSTVVSHDLADTIGWILPGLMRVFLSTDRVVVYEPRTQGDTAFAQQATDYMNYVFLTRCGGYRVLWSSFHDALMHRNGVIKHWWEPPSEEDEYKVEKYTGLTLEMLTLLTQEPGVEILEATSTEKAEPAPMGAEPEAVYYDVKIKRETNHCGRLMVQAVPAEEFLIDRSAKCDEDALFMAHRRLVTRSDLVKEGYKRDLVDKIAPYSDLENDDTKMEREEKRVTTQQRAYNDPAREKIEIFECYIKVDYDGDGIAEWRKVIYAGTGEDSDMLENEEWTDDLPFTSITGHPIPHRWQGRSIADDTMDIQRIKTVLMRQTLDNIYAANNPQREVVERAIVVGSEEELHSPTFGGIIRVTEPNTIRDLAVPFFAENSFGMLEYIDGMLQKRTGVSQRSMALEADALVNQTATQAQLQADQSYSKIELIARNFSEIGLKRLFQCLLKLVVTHQNVPDTVRLRDKPAVVTPSQWNADMDVTIDIGLGAGSRERDFMALLQISQKQEQLLMQGGPNNPFVDGMQYGTTLGKLAEAAGFKSSNMFFKEPNPEEMQAYAEQVANQPDPEMQKEQAKAQAQQAIEQAKLQASMQLEQAKMAASTEKEKAQAQADLVTKQADRQMQAEAAQQQMQLEMTKLQMQAQIEREKLQAQIMLKREEMAQQRELEAAKIQAQRESARMNVEQKREAGYMAAEAKSADE
jgi:hypothetical protein